MIQKDYDLKGVEFLKILGFLVLSLFIITGCSPNDEKESAETVTEVSTSVAESEIKEKEIETRSISEHFTKDLTDEVWIEINLDSNGQVSQNSQVSSFLVTNDTSHESDLYKGFSIYNPDEKGYVYINISDGQLFTSGDFKTKLIDIYKLYVNGELNQKIFKAHIDQEASFKDREKEMFGGVYASYPHANELTFTHLINRETSELSQRIDFKGIDSFYKDDNLNFRYRTFKVTDDEQNIEIKFEGYPKLYLVGFKGKGENGSSYLVKFSDKKENFIFDPMYSNKEIEIQEVSE